MFKLPSKTAIVVDVEQGSNEWLGIKAGVASCSSLDRLVTPSLKPSAQAEAYMYELTAEHITGEKKYIKPSYWMERGTEMEPNARAMYELITGVVVQQTGFVFQNKDRLFGFSPDGFPSSRKGLEIKCPAPITHLTYLLMGVCPKDYQAQVQGSMWASGLKAWDFMSFHPDYDPLIVTVERDPKWMDALDAIVPPFTKKLQELRKSDRVRDLRQQHEVAA